MSLALDIIRDAYRESNIISIDNATLTEPQTTEGLRLLNNVLSSVLGFEVGEGLQDWIVGHDPQGNLQFITPDDWKCPPANRRIICGYNLPFRIYFPQEPCDGARMAVVDPRGTLALAPLTLDAGSRTIEGATEVTLAENGLTRDWMYRAELGEWRRVGPVAVSTIMPYPTEFDSYFTTLLAMRLNPRYGRSLMQESVAWMERSQRALRARYRQKVVTGVDAGTLATSEQAYGRGSRSWMV